MSVHSLHGDRRRRRPGEPGPPPRPAGEDRRARRRSRSSRVSTPLRAWPACVACALALAAVAAVARVGPRVMWSRARVVLPLVVFVARVRAVRARRRAGRRVGPLSLSRGRAGDVRAGRRRRPRSARSSAVLLGATTSSRTCCTGSSALRAPRLLVADRRLHVPLPVRDRRRGAADAHRRSPRAATARGTRSGGGDRPRRDRAVPAHATTAASASTWRCSRAATRARCRGSTRWRSRRADAVFLAGAGAAAAAAARRCGGDRMSCAIDGPRAALPLPERRRRARRRRPVAWRTASASPCSARTAPARRR